MMKCIKRIMTAVLVLVLCPAVVSSFDAAGTYFRYEGIYYGINDNGEAYIHGSNGEVWDVVIREKFLNKYDVTEIEEYAFFENDAVEVLSFYEASHLRSLDECAFARCTKLGRVDITSSIQEMGMGVFDSCTSLEYIRFREGALKDIPRQCCYGCTALRTVILMNEPESIGPLAFGYCTALEQIEIPDSVTQIADNAFEGCDDLVIYCSKDSYALTYAQENGIAYVITDPEPETYILGDADGDGEVTSIDVVYVRRLNIFMAVDDPETVQRNGDVDRDGSIDIIDATYIQRFLALMDVPYPVGEAIPLSE